VRLFRVISGEHVTSVFPVVEDDEDNGGSDPAAQDEGQDG